MKVSAILKGRVDSNGEQPIIIRLNNRHERRFVPTRMKTKPEYFFKGRVKNTAPNHKIYNSAIQEKINEINRQFIEGVYNVKKYDLFEYITECARQWDKVKNPSTLKQHYHETTKLKRFKKYLLLSQVTPEILYEYQTYCYGLGNKQNTVWKTFKFLRLITRKAYMEGKIVKNPFATFKMPQYKNPQRKYLAKDQVEVLYNYCADPRCPDEIRFVGTWFLIGCYSGLRFGDMKAFKKENTKNDRLILYTQKTGEVVSFPMGEKLKTLFKQIDYRPMHLTNEYANRVLKLINKALDFKDISFHSSRHTFAVMCANAMISQEVTAKLLGHTSIRTTSIYYKITNQRIDNEIEKIL